MSKLHHNTSSTDRTEKENTSFEEISMDSQVNASQAHKNENTKAFTDDIENYDAENIRNRNNEIDYDPEEQLQLERVESIKSINDAIPDKFSGWGLTSVIGCAIFNFNTWGANSAYALYLQEYLKHSIFPGATKYSYAIVGGLAFGSGLTFAPLINYTIGKIGIKITIFIGIIIYFVAILLASFATKLWHIYCTQGVLAGIGMALICVANVNIVPQWFKGGPGGKRNLAMGIQAAGSGLGGIVYNIGLEKLLTNRSFRWSLRAQVIMCTGLNLISLFLIKSRNASIKPVFTIYDKLVWRNFGCFCLMIWIMFTLFGYVVLMYNLGDFTRSLGYGSEEASVVSTMVAVGIIYGRPSVGKIGDIIGPINVTIIVSWLVALFTWAMWIPCRNYATAIVFALFVGSLMGTIWLTMASINASIVGLKKLGIAMSISWIATGIFGFASPIIGIALKKNGKTSPTQYLPASIFVGLCYFMAGVTLVIVRGWLIARNKHVVEDIEGEDDVLRIRVSFKETISNICSYQKV